MSHYWTLIKSVFRDGRDLSVHSFFLFFEPVSEEAHGGRTWSWPSQRAELIMLGHISALAVCVNMCLRSVCACAQCCSLSVRLGCEEWMRSTAVAAPPQIKQTSGVARTANSQNRTWSQCNYRRLFNLLNVLSRKGGSVTPPDSPFFSAALWRGINSH